MTQLTNLCWAVALAQVLVTALLVGISPTLLKCRPGLTPREVDRILGGIGLAAVCWLALDIFSRHQWIWQLTLFASICLLWVDVRLVKRVRSPQFADPIELENSGKA